MKLLSRYISTTIISAVLTITLILMGIELLLAFIGELNNIGAGNYGTLQALRFVFLNMPYQLNALFPIASLIGSLIGLGVLASQSELIVMQCAGYSTGQILTSVLKAAFMMLLVTMILGEVVAPYTEHMAFTGKAIAKSGGQAINTDHGIWIREGEHFIHIQSIITEHHIKGITNYQLNSQQALAMIMTAKQGNYQDGHWLLTGVKESIFSKNKVASKAFSEHIWPVKLDPNILSIANTNPREMSMLKLHTYINYLKSNGLSATNYELSFWKRVMQPFATAVMILLALPFVFGPLRSVTMGLRTVTGIAIGFLFYLLNEFFGPLSELYRIPPFWGAVLPTLIFLIIGFMLLWRTR